MGTREKRRRLVWICILVVVGGYFLVHLARQVHLFVTRGDYQYYVAAPYLLLVPVGVGIVGGLAVWMFSRAGPRFRRAVVALGLIALGAGATYAAIWSGHLYLSLRELQDELQETLGEELAGAAGLREHFYVMVGFGGVAAAAFAIACWAMLIWLSRSSWPESRPKGERP